MKMSTVTAATEPVEIRKNDPGMMTFKEYLHFKNEDGKWHPDSAYDFTLESMNKPYWGESFRGDSRLEGHEFTVVKFRDTGFVILDDSENRRAAGVVMDNVLYHTIWYTPRTLPLWYRTINNRTVEKLSYESSKEVKYLDDYVAKVNNVAGENMQSYPVIVRRLKLGGEDIEIRSDRNPEPDRGDTLKAMNSEGLFVGIASDEWGATLIAVVKEYRGRGLGRILGAMWAKNNPSYRSGGYTSMGRALALHLWADRVREYAHNGWYSYLVRSGAISKDKVREIISALPERSKNTGATKSEQRNIDPNDILIYCDESAFVVYDAKFLVEYRESQSDTDYILGQGFIQERVNGDTYFYSLDYKPKYKKLITTTAMQFMYDLREPLFIGGRPSDIVELDQVDNVQIDGDYAKLTKPAFNLKVAAEKERRRRKPVDPYGEIKDRLLEAAQTQWG